MRGGGECCSEGTPMIYRVKNKRTGKVYELSAEQLATMPARAPRNFKSWPPIPADPNRAVAIKLIKEALRRRSGKAWSVTGGRGTGYGWIRIESPPARRVDSDGNRGAHAYYMSESDRAELGELLGLDGPVHMQGESIAANSDYRREYIERARGLDPTVRGEQYWD